ncbi:MAG: tRNA (adenosine(37)-N6)-threonylcarbamoyltransferase complex transferase subunit TsaD [Chloroflexota bacterium]|nr:tRNA (adenosine(37)-N6)-threonylcarbamoyltransferase complex transferase subunit TsaD [Chloroflexota bacterium]
MKILGIETSCDETAAAVVQDGRTILSNVIASQVDIHSRYGGIVPEVASRQHTLSIVPIIDEAMRQADASWRDIDAVAVTNGPGLAGSLLVGVNAAKAIAAANGLPIIGVNHIEGHVYANWVEGNTPEFPALCLIVSGGHSDVIFMRDHSDYKILGKTRDDAAGEAFDKVSRLLGLGYPGGPAIERAALTANGERHRLPRAWLKDTDDFSFSGLKTAVLRLVENFESRNEKPDAQAKLEPNEKANIAASFQEAVVDVLVTKTIAAAERTGACDILIGGGVAANRLLRQEIVRNSPVPVIIPSTILCTDNAAMIASCGYFHLTKGERSGWRLDVTPNATLPQQWKLHHESE